MRTRLLDLQLVAHENGLVRFHDGLVSLIVVGHFHESVTFRASRFVVHNHLARFDGSELFKGYVMDPGNTQVGDAVYVDANESGTLNIKYTWQKETSVAKPEGNPKDGESALKIKIIGPGGYEKEITYQDILEAGGTYTLNDLAPGSYAVIETNAEGLIKTYTLKSESETGVAVIVGKGEDGVIASLFNKYKQPPVKMDIPVVKVWNDNDDKDGNRPGAITVILSADGVEVDRATLTADVEWKHTFTDLDVFDAEGKEITYSISEAAVEWYTAEVNGYSITNNYRPEVTSVSVVKVWDDNDDALRRRPSSIAVTRHGGQPAEKDQRQSRELFLERAGSGRLRKGRRVHQRLRDHLYQPAPADSGDSPGSATAEDARRNVVLLRRV